MCNISGALKGITKKHHNTDALRFLAMMGADRGKDSMGIAYNGKIDYWVKDTANGSEGNGLWVFQTQPFPENIKSSIVLIHNRAATVGKVDENGAHPYIIDDVMVGMKNGTIHNFAELATKYQIDAAEYNTDSELLLIIINRYGTAVLKEYIGGCAMAWFFIDEPTKLYLWKGASKNHTKVEEERPLYYTIDEKNNLLYFNSLRLPLNVVVNCKHEIHMVPDNNLLCFENGLLISTEVIDRSEMSQNKVYDTYQTWDDSYFRGKSNKTYSYPKSVHSIAPVEVNPQNIAGTRIYHFKGCYYRNGHPLDGEFLVNMATTEIHVGAIIDPADDIKTLYFNDGVWIKDEETYRQIESGEKEVSISDVHPDGLCTNSVSKKFCINGKEANWTGCPKYFGYGIYTISNGELVKYHFLPNKWKKGDELLLFANKWFFKEESKHYLITRDEFDALIKSWGAVQGVDWTDVKSVELSLSDAVWSGKSPSIEDEKADTNQLLLSAWTGLDD